jgi:alanyl-tRNA synthetase
MQGSEVRRSFLDFFRSKGHLIVPSAPIVPQGDPTLMFTNAGMVQFKNVFLGLSEPASPRIADSQKCLRISGKHNDLEEVGRDTYHHTLFEMLGNWSFGDYYKAEAIEWAWELLTKLWGLPKDRLYATVYRTDDEAEKLWRQITGIPAERVRRFDEKDNFWEMGETGPCGPCSEIHIDRGPATCDRRHVAGHVCDVNVGCARYMELWNLVFIQYHRDEQGELHELPAKHIDTGMGLERVAGILENVDGNYEGSLLRDIIRKTERMSGVRYGANEEQDVSFRVLADHSRAVSFLVADGILPSNEGRGYVLRRLLRRAARHGKGLGFDRPFFFEVCDTVVETMGEAYSELRDKRTEILDAVRGEEERFQETLDRGLVHLEEEVAKLVGGAAGDAQVTKSGTAESNRVAATGRDGSTAASSGASDAGSGSRASAAGKVLPGEVAFRLHDTYGFPLDMTEDILRSRGIAVDREGFQRALERQRERGREAQASKGAVADYTLLVAAAREMGGVRFAGPFVSSSESKIIALAQQGRLVERAVGGDVVDVVTAETPFYGESGGQIGDVGTMETARGAKLEVLDAQKPAPDVIVHRARVVAGDVAVGDEVRLAIDARRREAIRLNHSSTHLLHAALRHRLGKTVGQAGSLVDETRLRFDFSHDGAVGDERLADIESEVNEVIRSNLDVTEEELGYDEAIARGALAFFGDKYGDRVRVVSMGDYSTELCGGTHVRATGDIGLFRLMSEGGIAAGVRRIEATTGEGALETVRRRDELLREIAKMLKAPEEQTPERIEKLLAGVRELERKVAEIERKQSGDTVADLAAAARRLDGTNAVVARIDGIDHKAMRGMSDQLRDRLNSAIVVLAGESDSGVVVTVAVTPDQASRWHAGKLIQQLVPLVEGRGGGKPDFAQAGGKNPAGIPALLEKANALLV